MLIFGKCWYRHLAQCVGLLVKNTNKGGKASSILNQ